MYYKIIIPTITPTLTPAPTLTPEEKERIKKYIITNRDKDSRLQQYRNMTEEELENIIDLFDYQVPLYGDLLATGDNLPIYPFIFGGISILILLYVIFHKRII